MLLEALRKPFTKRPKETLEQSKQKPLHVAAEQIAINLNALETIQWQGTYRLMGQWEGCIQILYNQCPQLAVNDGLAAIVKNAQQTVLKQTMENLSIEDLPIHPSWLKHGYVVDVDWKKVDLPAPVKKFLHHARSTDTTIQIGAHVTKMPQRELFDQKTLNHLSLWVGNRGVELLVTSDYMSDGIAGVPHTDYVSQLRFVKPLKGKPGKFDLKDPQNFDQFGESEMSRERAVSIAKIIQFAVQQSHKEQVLQDVGNWE